MQHSAIAETAVKQRPLSRTLLHFQHWGPAWGSHLRLRQYCFQRVKHLRHQTVFGSCVLSLAIWSIQGYSRRSVDTKWSPEHQKENIGINSSKPQSGILLHKHIHIYDHYKFELMIAVKFAIHLLYFATPTVGLLTCTAQSGNSSTTWFDFTPTGQHGKWYEECALYLIFSFYLNRETLVLKLFLFVVFQ